MHILMLAWIVGNVIIGLEAWSLEFLGAWEAKGWNVKVFRCLLLVGMCANIPWLGATKPGQKRCKHSLVRLCLSFCIVRACLPLECAFIYFRLLQKIRK